MGSIQELCALSLLCVYVGYVRLIIIITIFSLLKPVFEFTVPWSK